MNNLAFVVAIHVCLYVTREVFGVGGGGDNSVYMYGLGR